MSHLGLFEGIGGFSLAARWMGWETVAWVEINEFCQQVLKKNFPEAKGYGDIKQFDGTPYRGTIDILTGGFPCQPYSTAGKRKGKEDARHLWPEMLRVIREIQPVYVVGENVRGLTNWSGGLVFDEVQADLETEGYQVLPFLLPACAVNAPHRRDRIWFIAHSDRYSKSTIAVNEYSRRGKLGFAKSRGSKYKREDIAFRDEWLTQSPICRGDDGIPNRVDRIKSPGNAVVPQVVYEIFKAIDLCSKSVTNVK
jgi:DNA (cytosine-5)-methyltransferase 1